ncbi:MAG: hypothetical protein QOD92_84 [Acidimicrobiaceae bacterium]|jgi:hypothetical protein
MPEITCPSCGTVSHFEQLRREAEEFCRTCDYPLFWAKSTEFGNGSAADGSGESLRRLPGTAGRAVGASIDCPECTEPNPFANTICIRCGSELRPVPPEPVIILPPPPPPPPEPEPEPEPTRNWLPIIVGVTALIIVLVLILAFA